MNEVEPSTLKSHDDRSLMTARTVGPGRLGARARRATTIAMIVALLGAALALSAAPASAEITHKLVSQITGPSPTTQFARPWSMTFDAAGNLYVADPGSSIVDTFNSSNQPTAQLGSGTLSGNFTRGVAVDDKTGDVYAADSNHSEVFAFKPLGASPESGYQFLSQWKEPPFGSGCCYLYDAVDNHAAGPSDERAGDVYVLSSNGTLYVVKPEGALGKVVEELPGIGSGTRDGLAVDAATGNVYVAAPGGHTVEVFNDKGEEQPLLALTGSATPQGAAFTPTGVAIDDADEVIYVIDGEANLVDEFSMGGTWLAQITQTTPGRRLEQPLGIAVQEHAGPGQGEVYVSDGAVVDVFAAAGVVAADVTTGAASAVTSTSATLNGTVNPAEVAVSECIFEYRTAQEPSFAHSAPCTPSPGAGGNPVAVSANLSGLTPRTTYRFRLSATNANTANYGSEVTFFTPGAPQAREESAEVAQAEKAGQTTAILRGRVDPAGLETTYRFEYGETAAYGQSIPVPSGTLAAGEGFQSVATEVTGLHVGTTYHYRLVANNEDGAAMGEDQTFTTLPAVLVKAAVSHVTATSATLEAQIDPLGSDTTYYFQYGAADCATSPASCTSSPAPPADVGAGERAVEVAPIHLQQLLAGTTYHYRVVAQSAAGTIEIPDQTFTTQTAGVFALPDARAWELVSPPDKHGQLIEPIIGGGVTQAAAGGEAITYLASGPTESDPPGNSNRTQVLSARAGAAGSPWASRDISTPRELANGFRGGYEEPRFFASDLSVAVVQPWGAFNPSLSLEASEQTAYLRANLFGGSPGSPCLGWCYRPLVTGAPGFANVPAGTEFGEGTCHPEETRECGPIYEGASPDGSHVVLGSPTALAEGAPEHSLYEWAGGRLQLLSVLPASEGGGQVPGALGSRVIGGFGPSVKNAVSADGSRVVWSRSSGSGSLYVRDVLARETALLGSNAEFQTASSDGTDVIFTEAGDLKAFEAPLGGALSAGHVTDLISGANVIGMLPGASQDGTSIYFVSNAVLTSTPNPRGERAVAGTCGGSNKQLQPPGALCDLYLWQGGRTRLVAVISGEDNPVWQAGGESYGPTARVSPSGEWLAFMSERPLTGYDNRDLSSGVPDEEAFLYGAAGEGSLACASCNPSGARPHGVFDHATSSIVLPGDKQRIWAGRWLAANVPGLTTPLYQARYLTSSGRLFFNSNDALVPYDTNGGEDVYQYEPPGVGSCTSATATFDPRSGGCVDLISSGTAREGAAFLDASESGDDVFFRTSGQLSPQDSDVLPDVYDARVGGRSPVAQQPPACEGDACQSPAIAPNDSTPDSLTYEGPGNLTPQLSPAHTKKTAKQIKAEKLARALRTCKRMRSKTRHRTCERQARRRYGPARGSRAGKATNRRRAK